ncbi:hypothetical protein X975_14916, partial [Stegodyphus mimosarum]
MLQLTSSCSKSVENDDFMFWLLKLNQVQIGLQKCHRLIQWPFSLSFCSTTTRLFQ